MPSLALVHNNGNASDATKASQLASVKMANCSELGGWGKSKSATKVYCC